MTQAPTPISVTAAVEPKKVKVDFQVLDDKTGFQRLYRVERSLLTSAGYRLATIDGEAIHFHVDTKAGLKREWGSIFDVGGVYPEMLFVTYDYGVGSRASEGTEAQVYRAKPSGYQRVAELSGDILGVWDRIVMAKDGTTLVAGRDPKNGYPTLRPLYGRGVVPTIPPAPDVNFMDAVVMPSGEIVALAFDVRASRNVLYRWAADEKLPKIVPNLSCGEALRLGPEGDLFAIGGPGLVRVTNDECKRIESGPYAGYGSTARDAAFAPDGTLYVTDGNWHRPARALDRWTKAGWESIELPESAFIDDIETSAEGQLYVIINRALLRMGGSTSDWRSAVKNGVPNRVLQSRAASRDCQSNVVVLYGFTKATPDDYDFPQTRKALAHHPELSDVQLAVTREFGQKYFVALTRDFDKATKLKAIVEEKVRGSKPQVVCAEPELVREVKIDWATGEIERP